MECASRRLLALHRQHEVDCSAYLTACNPRSVRASAAENERAQQQLVSLIAQRGYRSLPGFGRDPAGVWPVEASVLVLGLAAAEACELARRFGQNALLLIGADGIPRLRWVQYEEVP